MSVQNSITAKIPDQLIYEMVNGEPIYYKGYRDCLNGSKSLSAIMGSSLLQSLIISRLFFFLQSQLGQEYQVLTNELGIQFAKKSWRAADIAIVKMSDLAKKTISNQYLHFAPKVVIEIDTKAELSEIKNPLGYYHEKTDELLAFGVEKVIWIFTDTRKVMIAQQNQPWSIVSWENEIDIIGNIAINVSDIIK